MCDNFRLQEDIGGRSLKKVLIVIGTRPEIIKTASVIMELRKDRRYRVAVCFTGQHQLMAMQMIKDFDIKIDYDLRLMKPQQSLIYIASTILSRLMVVYMDFKADLVILQGDTTTALCAALAAYYTKTAVAHIEAGLRTHDKYRPYPEELNRAMISRIADIHFAPTKEARDNLIKENIPSKSIIVTGNTVIDALLYVKEKGESFINKKLRSLPPDKKIILVTAHRRENFGKPLKNICNALKLIAENNKDVIIIYPVHLNPNVLRAVRDTLSAIKNILLIKPLNYSDFVGLMGRSYLILTDSGGIQEEAPSLGVPVLILRDKTERPEVVKAGCAKIVGTDALQIVKYCQNLLESREFYKKMSKRKNPVGDGKAAIRIKKYLDNLFMRQGRCYQ